MIGRLEQLEKELAEKENKAKETAEFVKTMEDTNKTKIQELNSEMELLRSLLKEAEESSRLARKTEIKKLVSSITKLMLSTFTAEQVKDFL